MDQTDSSPSRRSHLRATRGLPPPRPRPPSRLPAAAATTPFVVGGGGAPQPPRSALLLPPSFSPSSSSPLPTQPPWSCSRSSAAAGWCPLLWASRRRFGLPLRGSGGSGDARPTRSTLTLDLGSAPLPFVDALGPQPWSPSVATSLLRPSDTGATSTLRGPAPPACREGPPPPPSVYCVITMPVCYAVDAGWWPCTPSGAGTGDPCRTGSPGRLGTRMPPVLPVSVSWSASPSRSSLSFPLS
jgi:hypothetical protein